MGRARRPGEPAKLVHPAEVEGDGPVRPYDDQRVGYTAVARGDSGVLILTVYDRTFASSAPTAATRGIIAEFGVSREVNYLVTSVFLLGYVFGVRSAYHLSSNLFADPHSRRFLAITMGSRKRACRQTPRIPVHLVDVYAIPFRTSPSAEYRDASRYAVLCGVLCCCAADYFWGCA